MNSTSVSRIRLWEHMPAGIPFVRLFLALLVIDALLILAYVGQVALNIPSGKLTELVDLDGESSLCMWFSSMQLYSSGVLVGLVFWHRASRDRSEAAVLGLLGLFLLAMSVDEAIQLHEWVGWRSDALLEEGSREGTMWSVTGIWMFVIGIPAVAFAAWLLYRSRGLMPAPVLTWFAAGMAVLFAGALGAEAFANLTIKRAPGELPSTLAGTLQASVEEGLEMLGGNLLLGASLALFLHERLPARNR